MIDAHKLAYEAHRKYLDADSATSGPIEDYIAAAIEQAVRETAEKCAEIGMAECRRINEMGREYEKDHRYERADSAARMADQCVRIAVKIRAAFGLDAKPGTEERRG